jgi:hypothetical protein
VGITEWLLAWLIVNALFFVWRILVTSDAETRDQPSGCEHTFNVNDGFTEIK